VSLFPPHPGPRVFALPPGADFTRALADGLVARLGDGPPEALARVEIWVNTRRAGRALAAAFAGDGAARLLPRIRVVADLALDPRAPLDLAAPASRLGRKLELARLVAALLQAEPGLAAPAAAFDLAEGLADLLDEMQGEGVAHGALAALDAGEHAEHWRRSLRFLAILADYAEASPPIEGQGRMRAVAAALAAAWDADPPGHPVIVAGSTGSRGATRAFMAAVARLPQGALVLPGFDADLPGAVWERLGEADAADHPQAGFRRLADAIGFDPAAVAPWTAAAAPPAPERNRLVSLAMRPAPVTDQWRSEGAALAPTLGAALAGVDWIEAESPRAEARATALVLREAAECGTRAALVTPDRALARRVAAELARWGVIPDDSAGRPLALTPPGVLLARIAALGTGPLTPAALLALLKHPLTATGAPDRGPHRRLTEALELRLLRGGPPEIGSADLARWLAARGDDPEAAGWIAWIERALALACAPGAGAGAATLAERAARCRATAETLAAGPAGGPHQLWEKDAGAQALALMDRIAAEAEGFGPVSAADWRALLASELAGGDVPEEAVVTHASAAIWGTLEARVQTAGLVVLGGLNEGVWPRTPPADPWLSRPMRRELGLPSPERVIGLSAHDFQQAMGAARVVIARATRDADAPTVPSRWLLRLENLARGLGPEGATALEAARDRGRAILAAAAALDRPERAEPAACRPAPRPPAEARPAALSVTQVETLVRDPYAIYARHVLRLRALKPLGRDADALERGAALHAALRAFTEATPGPLPPDAAARFARETGAAIRAAAPWPAARALWTARLETAAPWFLATEAERRARGLPVALEIDGERAVEGAALPFRLVAVADRIDRTPAGAYAIYDYKSGGVPSEKEARHFHLQLPLEAAIAEAGGFRDLPAAPVAHMELIGLGARTLRPLDLDPGATWTRLARLVAAYQDEATGYPARLRPQRLSYESDYDHLSRLGEWADGDPIAAERAG